MAIIFLGTLQTERQRSLKLGPNETRCMRTVSRRFKGFQGTINLSRLTIDPCTNNCYFDLQARITRFVRELRSEIGFCAR